MELVRKEPNLVFGEVGRFQEILRTAAMIWIQVWMSRMDWPVHLLQQHEPF